MPSNTPILMLGVAGLGLSLAMFFDTKKRIKEDEDKLIKKLQEKENELDMNDNVTKVIDIYDMPEENEPTEENETTEENEPTEEKENINQEKKIQKEKITNYKDLYLKEKRKNMKKDIIIKDNRYKGNGSKFSKNLYFMKEAYRKSREQVPVDQNIALAVKIASEISDNDNESLGSIESFDSEA
ncbi:MAG: hypothetical protein GY823_05900 [Flavobacteriaceae bacterium]|nr:hypothetical protein [Flavobacteriaceae bacterium]